MATQLTPVQTKSLIEALNKEYADDAKNTKTEVSDFTDENPIPYKLENIRKALKQLPGDETEQKDMFEEKGVSTQNSAVTLWDRIEQLLGPEKFENFITPYVHLSVTPKPEKGAVISLEGPTAKEITVRVWEKKNWGDSTDILKNMSPSDRNAVIKKLNFDAEFKQFSDRSGEALFAYVPVKKAYLNVEFNADRFLKQANKRLARQSQPEVDQEELVEKLTQFFNTVGEQESEHMDTEEYAESYAEYAEEDANNSNLRDLRRNLDDDLETYVDRMKAVDIDDDQIKDLLIESAEIEFNGSNTNSIGSTTMGEMENQIDFGHYEDERYEDDIKALGLPYPQLTANLALLTEESAKELERGVREISIDVRWDPKEDGYSVDHGMVYSNSNNSWDFIVDPDEFMPKAKRMIKDAKLAKRGTKRGESALEYPTVNALLDEERYPQITALLKGK